MSVVEKVLITSPSDFNESWYEVEPPPPPPPPPTPTFTCVRIRFESPVSNHSCLSLSEAKTLIIPVAASTYKAPNFVPSAILMVKMRSSTSSFV